ncbi:ral guanine nucleotide dissociation stimulator-like 1, partial [Lampetra planeri]
MGKWELTMNPVQEWGEEVEDGAVYGVTLLREPVQSSPDSTPSSAFIQYRTSKVRRLKAASIPQLVAQLVDPRCQERDYGRIFLSTYRTFTSSTELMEKLFLRFVRSTSSSMTSPLSRQSAFVHIWLDEFSEDFRDPPLHPALQLLLDHLRISSAVYDNRNVHPTFSSLVGRAERLLRSFRTGNAHRPAAIGPLAVSTADTLSHLSSGPTEEEESADEDSGLEQSLDGGHIMDFSAVAVAEQLTRMDSALFVKVVPHQCLGCVWSQRDKKENMSPTIRATVAQFNAITNRVIGSLLCLLTAGPAPSSPPLSHQSLTTPAQRARIIEKWIRVAQECQRLKNFSSLRAILSALQSNAVYRLRRTWAAVSRDSMCTFDSLWETFPAENCVLTNQELLPE